MSDKTMRKVLFVILAMFGLAMFANAQSDYCKIIGTTDGSTATVAIENYNQSAKTVEVGFYNDSEKTVTIIAIVKQYGQGGGGPEVVATVRPQTSTTKKISWPSSQAPTGIKIKSAKCQ